jgi:hypothetical protein
VSSNGRWLITHSLDETARLWDLHSPDPALSAIVFSNAGFWGNQTLFSPDERWLITPGDTGAQLWSLDIRELLTLACSAAARNLTLAEWQQYMGKESYRTICPDLWPHYSYIESQFDTGADLARQGQIDAAKAAYNEAQRLNPGYRINAQYWNKLCRAGALWRKEKDIMDACGQAVELAPGSAAYRDSRGIARALIGDPAGAIDDFTFYIAWAKQDDAEGNKDAITRREEWIAALRAGNNPFDDKTLKALREELR